MLFVSFSFDVFPLCDLPFYQSIYSPNSVLLSVSFSCDIFPVYHLPFYHGFFSSPFLFIIVYVYYFVCLSLSYVLPCLAFQLQCSVYPLYPLSLSLLQSFTLLCFSLFSSLCLSCLQFTRLLLLKLFSPISFLSFPASPFYSNTMFILSTLYSFSFFNPFPSFPYLCFPLSASLSLSLPTYSSVSVTSQVNKSQEKGNDLNAEKGGEKI